jgi:hypothetical protein
MTESVQTALIAGCSALSGGILATISSVIVHRREEAKLLRQTYREKLENIANLIEQSVEWQMAASKAKNLDEISSLGRCESVVKAFTISCIFFPELTDKIRVYSDNLLEVNITKMTLWRSDRSGDAGTQAHYDHKFQKLRTSGHKYRLEIINQISEIAKRYNKL